MESLFYSLQSEKQIKRQIKILRYLCNSKSVVSVDKLAENIGCTCPTIRKDIQNLKSNLSENFKIITHFRVGYSIVYESGESVDDCIVRLVKNSVVYKIIDNIFHNKIYTLIKASELFFMSESALRRLIKHMNSVLFDFNISIAKNEIGFIGDEKNIRYFFFSFYYDFGNQFSSIDKNYYCREIYNDLMAAVTNSYFTKLRLSYYRFSLWVYVNKQRFALKKSIYIEDELVSTCQKEERFPYFKQFIQKSYMNNEEMDNLLIDEVVWLYLICLDCISYTKGYDKNQYVYCREICEKTSDNIEKALLKIPIIRDIDEETHNVIRSFLINISRLSKLLPLFQTVSNDLKEFIIEENNNLYLKWCEVLNNNILNSLLNIKYIEDVAVSLTMIHAACKKQQALSNIYIIFAFQGETGYEQLLMELSKYLLIEDIKVIYIFDNAITSEMIKEDNICLIISNYDLSYLKNLNCYYIRVSYIPSVLEWAHLKDVIHGLMHHHQ